MAAPLRVWVTGDHCRRWISCLFYSSGLQEQYELVYDVVIELFKRQIKVLDAREDSAASQVKVPGINALPLAALGLPALT